MVTFSVTTLDLLGGVLVLELCGDESDRQAVVASSRRRRGPGTLQPRGRSASSGVSADRGVASGPRHVVDMVGGAGLGARGRGGGALEVASRSCPRPPGGETSSGKVAVVEVLSSGHDDEGNERRVDGSEAGPVEWKADVLAPRLDARGSEGEPTARIRADALPSWRRVGAWSAVERRHSTLLIQKAAENVETINQVGFHDDYML